METKAQLRAEIEAHKTRTYFHDGWPVVLPVPVTVVKSDRFQELSIRRKQGTAYMRPKPGHDGGTPQKASDRRQIEYVSRKVTRKGEVLHPLTRVMQNAKLGQVDILDEAVAEFGRAVNVTRFCPHKEIQGLCKICS